MNNEEEIAKINSMSRLEVCKLWRFAPVGHRYFDITNPLHTVFEARFKELGGFTPEISKQIGW